eukprot:GHVR01162928.1.p1 GENE.GHVR01162928.1~~GHVR01162928.1.p1  ORF type:complete len:205 (+),score=44.29 GHVR01162928.1:48-662(+)
MPGVHTSGCGCRDVSGLLGGEFLLPFIIKDRVYALNEKVSGTGVNVIKSWEDRVDDLSCETPNDDHEIIIHIPFTNPCKIQTLYVIGGDNGCSPVKVKIYSNCPELDFNDKEDVPCVQELELLEDFHAAVEYPLKVTHLQNVQHLTLLFEGCRGGDCVRIHYIGLRGVGSKDQRRAVITTYEQKANLADHEVPADEKSMSNMLM